MGWSLNFRKPEDADLLDAHLLSLGKALFLATAFEGKCRFLARIWKMVEVQRQTGDFSAALELANALKVRQLGPTIDGLTAIPFVGDEHYAILVRAKDARNYIAHEAGAIGGIDIPRRVILDRERRLREEVLALVPGDNLVSTWIYELERKEPAPPSLQHLYPTLVETWVFGVADGA